MLYPLARIGVLTAVYVLVLGEVELGDVLVGITVGVILVAGGRFVHSPAPGAFVPATPARTRLAGIPALLGGTLVDMTRGAWTVSRYCLRPPADAQPGVVTIPIGRCAPSSAATWGVRVGIAPDTVVVDIDEARGQMLLHVLDAQDADAVRARELDSYERRQRRVFP